MSLSTTASLVNNFLLKVQKKGSFSSICTDSRQFHKDDIFIAVRGGAFDGHLFVSEACSQGAAAVVVEDASMVPSDYIGTVLHVEDSRQFLAYLIHQYLEEPSKELFSVGITGTNGKTTAAYMVESILNEGGMTTGVMGTIDHHIKDQIWNSSLTTPDPITLHSRLKDFLLHKGKAVVMEISSHALLQRRVEAVDLDIGIFTNLTQDHLDYHGSMEKYFQAKELLFSYFLRNSSKKRKYAIIHKDDDFGTMLIQRLGEGSRENLKVWSYGKKSSEKNCDFEYEILYQNFDGSCFRLYSPVGNIEIHLPLIGSFNIQNAVAALAVGVVANLKLEVCAKALKNFLGVPGRLQFVPNSCDLSVFVDYAHTPDALDKILLNLQQLREQLKLENRIITVFGCGGDRDKEKRPLMAKAAERGSDFVVLTSDNPRTEEAEAIIDQVSLGFSSGFLKNSVKQESQRKEAIGYAFAIAQPGDVVVIAGKGHECEQIVGDQIFPFDDYKVAKDLLNGMDVKS